MRSVSTRFLRAAALLALLVAVVVPSTYADEDDGSLSARITPPGGAPASGAGDSEDARISPPIGIRILPPIGAPAPADEDSAGARILPPGGAAPVGEGPSFFEEFLDWLARIQPPIG
jgi:hypothetical protein